MGMWIAHTGGMSAVIALIAVALLAGLLGSLWLRRGDIEGNGESGSMLLGVIFCFIAVMLILVAAGRLWA
jgi:hypothetical protein